MSDVSGAPPPGSEPARSGPAEAAPDRPLGLSLLIWLLWFWTGAVALVVLGLAIGDGPVLLSGRAVPRPDALVMVLPILLPMGVAAAGAALALGLDRPWARPAVLLPFALAALAPAFTGAVHSAAELFLDALVVVPIMAAVAGYLYASGAVRAHFERLRRVGPRTSRPGLADGP